MHVLADTLGSAGVLFSCFLIKMYGDSWQIADPICALIVSIMIFISVLPLIKMSCEALLLQTPEKVRNNRKKIIEELENLGGKVKKFDVFCLNKGKYNLTTQLTYIDKNIAIIQI